MNTFILDFETTGLNPYHNEIIEIAIKKFNSDKIYSDLVKPKLENGRYISDKIIQITNITNIDIDERGISQIQGCINLFNFIKENSEPLVPIYIIAHNGTTFDFIYLHMLVRRYKEYCFKNNINCIDLLAIFNRFVYIDTLLLSRFLLPARKYYSQKSLCITYKIKQNYAHRAYGDVADLEKIYTLMVSEYLQKNNINLLRLNDSNFIYNLFN
jgi:DNA polymerase III alpha subunit (gram-positive type)